MAKLPRLSSFRERIRRFRGGEEPPAPDLFEKERRGVVSEYGYVMDEGGQIIPQSTSYDEIIRLAEESAVLRIYFRAIMQTILANGWALQKRFAEKCVKCGYESTGSDIDTCPICGFSVQSQPDPKQYETANNLLKSPNGRESFEAFLKGVIFYGLATDDYYISVNHKYYKVGERWFKQAYEAWVEDPSLVLVVADKYGNLGNDEYFCPQCYKPDKHYTKDEFEKLGGICPGCGIPLEQTAYVQSIDGEIRSRYGKDEMIHRAFIGLPSRIYGQSRVKAVAKIIKTLDSIDQFLLELYTVGHLTQIIALEGGSQTDAFKIKAEIESDINRKDKREYISGRTATSKRARTAMIGLSKGKLSRISVAEDFADTPTFDLYKMYWDIVGGVFGIPPSYAGLVDSSSSGVQKIESDVMNRTIGEYHRAIEDMINSSLLPLFGVTDWCVKFNPIEAKDMTRESERILRTAQSAAAYRQAGLNVRINEHGELEAYGDTGELPPPSTTGASTGESVGRGPRFTAISERSGEEIARNETPASEER